MKYFTSILLFTIAFFATKFNHIPTPPIFSLVFTLLFALPSLKTSPRTFFFLATFGVIFETFAILTRVPYSSFYYSDKLGYKFFGLVPLATAFSWPSLILGAASIFPKSIFKASLFVVLTDLVLDPGITKLGYWVWQGSGFSWYGVPIQNFLGWFLSALFGLFIAKVAGFTASTTSLKLILFYWTFCNLFLGLYIPFMLGLLTSVYLTKHARKI